MYILCKQHTLSEKKLTPPYSFISVGFKLSLHALYSWVAVLDGDIQLSFYDLQDVFCVLYLLRRNPWVL